ncbi:hypothetical protein N4599_09620 [Limosilactobacillus oris]|uniref:hypothetical protein n=1 Tax=Limosilactobacillus oris TaxID=1632 RepID=UPI0021B2B617|nr:hypothetical protein [Limosilactobacillus oris]UXC67330.1 hypothetical protein N4599_09620 [Limosilactobacillus oris]
MKAGVMVSKRFMTSYLYVSMSTPAKLLYIALALASDKDGNISNNHLQLPNRFSRATPNTYQELIDNELIRATPNGYQVDVVICGM